MRQSERAETAFRWLRTVVLFLLTLVICLLFVRYYQGRGKNLVDTISQGYLPQSPLDGYEMPEGLLLICAGEISLAQNDMLDFVLDNDTESAYAYGGLAALEIRLEDEWFNVPMQSAASFSTTYWHLPAHTSASDTVDLKCFYTLTPGKYRLVKEIKRSPMEQYLNETFDWYQGESVYLFAEFTVTA